ncbi:MAG: GntR family transcriptional regulator [Nitrospirota bacterium]
MKVSRVQSPIRQQTVSNLRNAIVEGHFKPGERLLEKELCRLTGVSRTSIRESLRQLEAEGLIKVIPNKGPVVATVTIDEARDLYEVRQVLEGLACRLFAEKGDLSQITALTQTLDRLGEFIRKGVIQSVLEAKNDFYNIILQGCGNTFIHPLLKSLHARIAFLRSLSLSQPGRPVESLSEIKCIVEAIQKRDPAAAWEASVNHVRKAQEVVIKALSDMQGM